MPRRASIYRSHPILSVDLVAKEPRLGHDTAVFQRCRTGIVYLLNATIMAKDDFDIESLAARLQLPSDQIRKMAERDKLPGRRVAGRWRFSRAEIHHWLEDRIGVSDESQLLQYEKVLETQNPGLECRGGMAELLSLGRVAVPLNARTKSSAIEKMCELAADSGALWLPREMATAIGNREELHPTALGNGVALLHPRRPQPSLFGESFLAMGITASGIPFGGPRGVLTDIFFLIGSAEDSGHLRLLARMSRLLQLPDLLDTLRAAESAGDAWQIFIAADEALD